MIFDHSMPEYRERWERSGINRYNGAFYYSKEIVKNIIPNVNTGRNWVTINQKGKAADHSIVFIHNNLHPEHYDWLGEYEDLILVCGVESTCDKIAHLGVPLYLPLSIDVEEVKEFYIRKKDRDVAFCGRPSKRHGVDFGSYVDILEGLPRKELLRTMAHYTYVYAVGRTAIEAKVLGCTILPYDDRFPDPDIWKVMDNKEAACILQTKIDAIDRSYK